MTGTAGPDIHAVYILENQYPQVMPFEDNKGIYGGIDYLAKLDGIEILDMRSKMVNFKKDGMTNGAQHSLHFTYKWNGKEFVVIDAMYEREAQ
ncbi:MAG: hypothetical protein IPK04_09970 [Bdellovibrionales bacterium]|nr:hypothetical protein [Bdellovibrionales bacterium]